jgi:hypothetical protein
MVGHWPLDTGKLRDSSLTTTVTPPSEATWEIDFDVNQWGLAQPQDFAFIFTPRGKLVTNGLPHFDGAYHILVSHGGQSAAAGAPGASGLPVDPTLFSPTQVGSPCTVSLDPAGAVWVTPGVVGAVDGASFLKEQAPSSPPPTPPVVDPPPTIAPTVTDVSVLPNPATLNLPTGVNLLLAPDRHTTITTRATSPERVPLFCRWTATAGGVSSGESVRMTYLPDTGEWESVWQLACAGGRFPWRPVHNPRPGPRREG